MPTPGRTQKQLNRRLLEAWTPPRPKSDTADLIMTLPPELRNRVYELTLIFDEDIHTRSRFKTYQKLSKDVGFLRVSKLIRNEALPVYLGNNSIIIHNDSFAKMHFRRAADWLHAVVSMCGTRPFKAFIFKSIHGRPLNNLDNLLPVLHVIRETGLILDDGLQRSGYLEAIEQGASDRELIDRFASLFDLRWVISECRRRKHCREWLFWQSERRGMDGLGRS